MKTRGGHIQQLDIDATGLKVYAKVDGKSKNTGRMASVESVTRKFRLSEKLRLFLKDKRESAATIEISRVVARSYMA
ncbi:hypothetical protein VCRA2126O85_20046 [Vibrio crassostreae]|nr:hypothetical protein VCRA2127O91_20048 [Vibrio crassostreae]CAK2824161.1 hypothetical protein VCRA2126O86_20046 [Vibrio crassostreae]CAK2828504.1 hypothetical protein VCRA2126O85_20046 [Vibrio crassostreae]CAK2830180.1 hypothetical protein VCRA2125O83_20048 [Vibrio crassostreae]CAK2918419.1 hypothetical protein VCRA2128O106_30021 [Vibrio crassostreae]